jgi:hypothetical protein
MHIGLKNHYMDAIEALEALLDDIKKDFEMLDNPTQADIINRDEQQELVLKARDLLNEGFQKVPNR